MKFRDDIDPKRTWVTSDSHFGHNNIIGFCHRPPDHEQIMMERWARAVPEEDSTLLHLGDLSYTSNAKFKNLIAPHLTGERKLLVRGNHDKQRFSFYRQSGFKLAQPFAIALSKINLVPIPPQDLGEEDSWIISFSHYPWSADDHSMKLPGEFGAMSPNHIRIHGHIHNSGYFRDAFVPFLKNHINISIEQTRYRPVLLANLISGYLDGTVSVTADEQDGEAITNE